MRDSPFAFLRGTFYRWSHHFAAVPDEVRSAPSLLIVGDLHLENFGTWPDRDVRRAAPNAVRSRWISREGQAFSFSHGGLDGPISAHQDTDEHHRHAP
jgi:hypothetical protein